MFGGLGFTGLPSYVECADDNIKTFGNCSALTICIEGESLFLKQLKVRIPQRQIVVENSFMSLVEAFRDGKCNAIATESTALLSASLRAIGYKGDLSIGTREYTSEMWALKTLGSDPEWHDFTNACILALLAAEDAGVTKEDAHRMGKTSIFGDEFENMFIDAVSVGNFGEVWDHPIPRSARNTKNDGSTGLLASPPLGNNEAQGFHGAFSGGTLEAVVQRGVLHCGIRGQRLGFASYNPDLSIWDGMDVDYCRALASALFDGSHQNVIFHDIDTEAGFKHLREGTIDVFSGAIWTLQDDMQGFSFSQPYFYGPVGDTR